MEAIGIEKTDDTQDIEKMIVELLIGCDDAEETENEDEGLFGWDDFFKDYE